MKPPSFDYEVPDTLSAALTIRAGHGGDVLVLAGGQSLVPRLSLRRVRPKMLLDLNRISELAHVTHETDAVTIGAMTRQRTIERDEVIRTRLPLLHAAVRLVGHPHVRNRGTVGGSLAHADPAAELPAAAIALGADLVLANSGSDGTRTCPAERFFTGRHRTALAPTELLTAVRFPLPLAGTGSAIVEVAPRQNDPAIAGAAALIAIDGDGICSSARLVLFGVASTPVRIVSTQHSLVGRRLGKDTVKEAARAVVDEIDPIDDLHAGATYRRELAVVLARRAITRATATTATDPR